MALAVALAIVATTPSFLYWSLGGLETPFVALLWVAITIAALRCWDRPSRRAALALGAALSLLVLARPEGLLALLVPAAMLALRRSSGRALAPALLLPAAVFAALCLWRLARFGAVWPNPVLAKASLSFASLRAGAAYLGAFLTSSVLMAVLGAVLAARVLTAAAALARGRASREEARRELVLLSPSVLILTQSVAVGGDWMEFFRFLQPAVPLLAVSLGGLVAGAWVRSGGAVRSALVAVLVGLLASNLAQRDAVQAPGGWTMRSCAGEASPGAPLELWNLVYARDARELFPFLDAQAHELAARAGGGLVIATPQMGQLPYHLRRRMPALDVRFVDTRGLCDSDLARLDVPKGPFGLAAGGELAAILAGERGALSDAVRARGPNLLYQVRMSDAEIEQLEALGFELVHRGAHAVLLLRASETPR